MTRRIRTVWAAGLLSCSGGEARDDPSLVHTVRRGDLAITVRERGELQAARDTRVVSELSGRNTLIYLIPEGSVVEEGDRLAEFDASEIEEKRTDQAISVVRAKAALDQARKRFEVMEKELIAAETTEDSRLQIAQMQAEKLVGQPQHGDGGQHAGTNREMVAKLEELLGEAVQDDPAVELKYSELVPRVLRLLGPEENLDLKMGEIANQVLRQINEISLSRADLELAAETLRHSQTLHAKGFLTKNELDRDRINHQRQLSEIALAWNDLELLINYTLPESLISTQQEVENARLALESVRASNEATRVRESAELEASEAEFELADERLADWTEQVSKKVLYAPTPGLVVYGRYDWDEPVYEGMEVRERQEVIILPDVTTMVAELDVHEAQIDKVAEEQKATVHVDAFPGRVFDARVSRVSSLPDPERRDDVKVYEVKVELTEGNGPLRPGMNATVVIEVGTLRDVLTVPLPALDRRGDQQFVWLATSEGPVAGPVELGANNLTHVEVVSGLREGDRVHLVRPRGVQAPEAAAADSGTGATDEASVARGG